MSVNEMDTIQASSCENNLKQGLTSKECEPTYFRNNSHSARILEDLQSLRKNEVLCDIRIETDDGCITFGHKIVLIAASPYFSAMFSHFEESNKDLVNIRELDSTILQVLVDYIYTGEIMVTKENVQVLLPAANFLQLEYVINACAEFLQKQLDASNCIGIRSFADLHYCTELLSSSEALIKKQFLEVVKSDEFLSLSSEDVVKIISCNDLAVPYEEKVYECIINWVNHELDRRIEFLPGLMEHVRLPLASVEYILEKVVEEPLIKNSSKCNSYVIEALHFHLHKLKKQITIPQTIRNSFRQPGGFPLQKVILVLSLTTTIKNSFINWYDPTTNQWGIVPEMTKCRYSAGLSLIKDTFLFAVGGVDESSSRDSRSVEMLDLTSQSKIWVPTVDMLISRTELGVAVLDDCTLYAVGGYDGDNDPLNSVEIFNVSIEKWQMVSSMTIKRGGLGVGVLNNHIYAVGGNDGYCELKSVEYYDPTLDTWTRIAEMSVCREGVCVGVLDGVIYAIGGVNETKALKSAEIYKPSDGVWTSIADMHECRSFPGVVAFNGLLYVMGGMCPDSSQKSFEFYNPATNSWTIESIDSNIIGDIYAAVVFNKPPFFRFT